jgi:hypothetical protein
MEHQQCGRMDEAAIWKRAAGGKPRKSSDP